MIKMEPWITAALIATIMAEVLYLTLARISRDKDNDDGELIVLKLACFLGNFLIWLFWLGIRYLGENGVDGTDHGTSPLYILTPYIIIGTGYLIVKGNIWLARKIQKM